MRLLLAAGVPGGLEPHVRTPGASLTDAELSALYDVPPGPWVRANFVTTVDGAAAGPDGRSASINTDADFVVFELLRAQCDVVLVGAGTVRDEQYTALTSGDRWASLCGGRGPAIAVVSRRGDLPARVTEPRESAGPVLLVTCSAAPRTALDSARERIGEDNVLVHGEDSVDLGGALEDLAGRGLRRVLCEGGPSLLGDVLRAGRLDELCLTISPLVVAGDQLRVVTGPDVRVDAEPVLLVEEDGTVMGRWLLGPLSPLSPLGPAGR